MDKNNIIRFFFPVKCMFCGDIITNGVLCEKCTTEIEKYKINDKLTEINHSCFKNLDKCISFYYYKDIIRESLLYAKFKSCGRFLNGFIQCMPIDFKLFCKNNNIDFVVSMPAHKSKFYSREYDLPQQMTRLISKTAGVEYNKKVIVKNKITKNQHNLSLSDRKNNLKNAFVVTEQVKGKNILLVDDIISTGYSLEEVAKCFKRSGANTVIAVTFAYNKI